jgi:hypothetical protein
VLTHAIHEGGPLEAAHVAGPVVDLRGGGHLTANLQARDEHGREIGPGRVDGRRVAGGAGSENQQSAVFDIGHACSLTFSDAFAREYARETAAGRAPGARHNMEHAMAIFNIRPGQGRGPDPG